MPIYSGDDRRRLVPQALVQVLTCLIDATPEFPSPLRAELRTIRTRLCRLYKLADPQAPSHEPDVAQMMEDADGIPIEE